MKVKIGPYIPWIGPYQIAEKILFWKNKFDDKEGDEIHEFGNKLSRIPYLTELCQWIYNKRQRKISVKIDRYDTWSADVTLAHIIVPLLKQLKDDKSGCPSVDDDDVPEHLKSTSAKELTEEEKNSGHTDELWSDRWDYVLGEMIWTFEQKTIDWEDQYYSGEVDHTFEKVEGSEFYTLKNGPNHTFKVDVEGKAKHQQRMNNGFRLFGKYYECLWS